MTNWYSGPMPSSTGVLRVEAVGEPSEPRARLVFGHGQRFNVAHLAAVQVARGTVVDGRRVFFQ
jgi:hypothetical protein